MAVMLEYYTLLLGENEDVGSMWVGTHAYN